MDSAERIAKLAEFEAIKGLLEAEVKKIKTDPHLVSVSEYEVLSAYNEQLIALAQANLSDDWQIQDIAEAVLSQDASAIRSRREKLKPSVVEAKKDRKAWCAFTLGKAKIKIILQLLADRCDMKAELINGELSYSPIVRHPESVVGRS